MPQDLFIPSSMTKSKKEQVYDFIKSKGRARTSEVIKFGTSIFYNRAERTARNLADIKYTNPIRIWRMADNVKMASEYANSKEDIWSTYPNDKDFS